MHRGTPRSVAVLIVSIISTVPCQTVVNAQSNIRIGIEGGLNIANQVYSRDPFGPTSGISQKPKRGLIIGGVVEISLSEPIFINSALRYVQKGTRFEGVLYLEEYTLGYVEIAANIRVKINLDFLKLLVFVGPDIGLNVHSRGSLLAAGPNGTIISDSDSKDQTEPIDFAFRGGAGLEYELTQETSLLIKVAYSLGLVDINKRDYSGAPFIHSNGIQLTSGVMLSL